MSKPIFQASFTLICLVSIALIQGTLSASFSVNSAMTKNRHNLDHHLAELMAGACTMTGLYAFLNLYVLVALIAIDKRSGAMMFSTEASILLVLGSLALAHLNSRSHPSIKKKQRRAPRNKTAFNQGLALATFWLALVILISGAFAY